MLACARIGAVHSVVFGGFAPQELAVRIDDARPKVVVTASCGIEPSRVVEYKPILDKALERGRARARRRWCSSSGPRPTRRCVEGRDLDWDVAMRAGRTDPAACVEVAATDPLYILYTSGTTGKPKGVVRDNGGHAVALAWSLPNIYGIGAGDVWWTASDVGWVVGHSYIVYAPLITGATTVLYEGKPVGTPDAGAFWRVVAEHGVQALFTAPTAFRAIKKEDPDGTLRAAHDVSSLRTLFLAGERLDPDTYQWATDSLGIPVVDHWWQTETGWPIAANLRGLEPLPIKPGSPSVPVPGWDVRVLDERGERGARRHRGRHLRQAAAAAGLAADPVGATTSGTSTSYLSAFDGYYLSGDGGYVDEDGYLYVMGRTDDVINVAGHRLSTGSMEAVLAAHPAVAECAVIGVADPMKGQLPRGFVVLKAGVRGRPRRARPRAGGPGARRDRRGRGVQGRDRGRRPAQDPQRQDPAQDDARRSPTAPTPPSPRPSRTPASSTTCARPCAASDPPAESAQMARPVGDDGGPLWASTPSAPTRRTICADVDPPSAPTRRWEDGAVQRRDVVVLGSTGSIGTQALDLVRANPDRFRVVGLTAGGSQPGAVRPAGRGVRARRTPGWARTPRPRPPGWPATWCSTASPAPSGCGRRWPRSRRGTTLALANKESLIIGGPLVTRAAAPGQIVPVDSEHSRARAVPARRRARRRYAASCSPPRAGRSGAGRPTGSRDVTPEQALAHPTWAMGPVITVNSATLVNKGLEVIEAHLLFGLDFDRIEVVVHPTSVVHSMVEFVDGSTLAQASPPTMLIPIALGLAWPDRVPDAAPPVDWTTSQTWEFFPLDDEAFPAVGLAREAGIAGGTAPAVVQRRQRGLRRRVPRRPAQLRRHRPHGARRCWNHTPQPRPGTLEAARSHRRRRPRRRRLGPGAGRRSHPSDQGRRDPMTAAALHPRRGRLRGRHPGVDRAARARPHDPGEEVRREGHAVLHRLRPDGLEQAAWARPSTASRRSRSAATSRSSGCCRRAPRTSATVEYDENGEQVLRVRKSNTGMFTQLISDARAAEWEHV